MYMRSAANTRHDNAQYICIYAYILLHTYNTPIIQTSRQSTARACSSRQTYCSDMSVADMLQRFDAQMKGAAHGGENLLV
jgi:hypothetical protein